jgi:ribonuclease P protein component
LTASKTLILVCFGFDQSFSSILATIDEQLQLLLTQNSENKELNVIIVGLKADVRKSQDRKKIIEQLKWSFEDIDPRLKILDFAIFTSRPKRTAVTQTGSQEKFSKIVQQHSVEFEHGV